MPGRPRPAERNDPGRLELAIEATPWIAVMEGVVPDLVESTGNRATSTPACKLCVEGFCGLAGVGTVCAMLEVTRLPAQKKATTNIRGLRFIKTPLDSSTSVHRQ